VVVSGLAETQDPTEETDVASTTEHSIPDVADGHRRLVAFALLALGVRYGVSAIAFLTGPDAAPSLELLGDGLALLAVGLVVPIFIWKARHWSHGTRHLYENEQGFVAQTIVQAQTGSWTVTFLALVLIETLDQTLGELSWVFLFDGVLALMLLSFSLTFLYLERSSSWDPAEEDDA